MSALSTGSANLDLLDVAQAAEWWKTASPERGGRHPWQIPPPGDWRIWNMRAGRGSGKTRGASELIREWANAGNYRHILVVVRTHGDLIKTVIEGESGIMACCRFDLGNIPRWHAQRSVIHWPNGVRATCFSAEEPESLRGPQGDAWWADELATWRYMQTAWDNLQFMARTGPQVRGIVTSTPRPVRLLKDIEGRPTTVTTRASTFDNAANLAPNFIQEMRDRYEGTRLGRQELYGEYLDDNPDALWKRDMIEATRVSVTPERMFRVVVGVDPSGSDNEDSAECGIVAVGAARVSSGPLGIHFYVLSDLSMRGTPLQWATATSAAYSVTKADRVVYEKNWGGLMVAQTLQTVNPNLPLEDVNATRGKTQRAEPIAALYEQKRVHHVGFFDKLEEQMCEYDPRPEQRDRQKSPDRMDALVWALTALKEGAGDLQLPDTRRLQTRAAVAAASRF